MWDSAPVPVLTLAVLTGLATVLDWGMTARGGKPSVRQWVRPAPVVLMAVTAVVAGALDEPAGRWLVVALVLGAVGDAFLVDPTPRRFIGGLLAFLLGHLAYLICFLEVGIEGGWWLVPGTVVVATAFFLGANVIPGAHRRGGSGLAAAVTTYMSVIGATAVVGWATGSAWIAAGITVFLASDTMLGINRFDRELPWAKLPIIATYHVGQALMTVGVLLAL